MSTKILCAMSGGVDSSVAAALLKEQGFEVIGTTMQIFEGKNEDSSCCGLSEINDAKKVCRILKIPHYTLNLREAFKKYVIDNFIEEYKNGRTPNPCIRCNKFLKFDLLIKKAEELGCDYLATGHYARIKSEILNPKSEFKLCKGIDRKKDQSYVLYTMNQKSLSKTLFPLGESTKEEVRKLAKKFNLPVAEKKESQDLCFNPPVYPSPPGDILDTGGKIVGGHSGISNYTIGQKKGIGAHGKRKFVVKINAGNNSITIGGGEDLLKERLCAVNLSFTAGVLPEDEIAVRAKIRYNCREAEAKLRVKNGRAEVFFEQKQRAVTPGQSVVFYRGDEVLGGGIIANEDDC